MMLVYAKLETELIMHRGWRWLFQVCYFLSVGSFLIAEQSLQPMERGEGGGGDWGSGVELFVCFK